MDELVAKAKSIAYHAHEGQVDRAGKPYTEHLDFVAANVTTDEEKCVAYLHDLFEDTDYPRGKIRELFGIDIFRAVCAITRQKDESYTDYIQRVTENSLAARVKIADLTHNMMLERVVGEITEEDLRRNVKYRKALKTIVDSVFERSGPIRMGHWIPKIFSVSCSICGHHEPSLGTPYCSECGAWMQEQVKSKEERK